MILGAPTLEEFERRPLPPHCKVTRRKLHGPRMPVRGQRQVTRFSSAVLSGREKIEYLLWERIGS